VINGNSKKHFTRYMDGEPAKPGNLVIDELTGDLYKWDTGPTRWKTICNAGLHSRVAAENDRETQHILYQKPRRIFSAVKQTYEPYRSTNQEVIVRIFKVTFPAG
jgi:hypothetical protein